MELLGPSGLLPFKKKKFAGAVVFVVYFAT
jgi:hypothetical protein